MHLVKWFGDDDDDGGDGGDGIATHNKLFC